MRKHPLSNVLPDYGDRDFVLDMIHTYVMDHLMKHLKESAEHDWNLRHAEYANLILTKLGGTPIDVNPFKKIGGIFNEEGS